jgi:hypothetical protein
MCPSIWHRQRTRRRNARHDDGSRGSRLNSTCCSVGTLAGEEEPPSQMSPLRHSASPGQNDGSPTNIVGRSATCVGLGPLADGRAIRSEMCCDVECQSRRRCPTIGRRARRRLRLIRSVFRCPRAALAQAHVHEPKHAAHRGAAGLARFLSPLPQMAGPRPVGLAESDFHGVSQGRGVVSPTQPTR